MAAHACAGWQEAILCILSAFRSLLTVLPCCGQLRPERASQIVVFSRC
jgi:hypothetical protein